MLQVPSHPKDLLLFNNAIAENKLRAPGDNLVNPHDHYLASTYHGSRITWSDLPAGGGNWAPYLHNLMDRLALNKVDAYAKRNLLSTINGWKLADQIPLHLLDQPGRYTTNLKASPYGTAAMIEVIHKWIITTALWTDLLEDYSLLAYSAARYAQMRVAFTAPIDHFVPSANLILTGRLPTHA